MTNTNSPALAGRYRIDVQYHSHPAAYVERLRELMAKNLRGFYSSTSIFARTAQMLIDEMNANAVAATILSMAPPGLWFGDVALARDLARIFNEDVARRMADFPGRFGLFAALPLPDADAALGEIEYALDVLKADGVGMFSSYDKTWLGHDRFHPVMEELNRRRAIVYVHPIEPPYGELDTGVNPSAMEYVFDTTRTLVNMLAKGTFRRYPNVRFIFAHGGGVIAVLAGRLKSFFEQVPDLREAAPQGVQHELGALYYDTAFSVSPPTMAALRALVPVSQILFGSDGPYSPIGETIGPLDDLGFSTDDLRAINHANALRLFPRFADTLVL